MIIADCHTHSDFSGDCVTPLTEMVDNAIDRKLKYLAITEHHDLDFPHCNCNFELDIESYYPYIADIKEKYKDSINILIGMELGMQTHLHETLSRLVKSRDYDFILASSHLIVGKDPYDEHFFRDKPRNVGYKEYFNYALEQIENFDEFDAYGHLDYVIRYWLGDDKKFEYDEFQDVLDPLLNAIIKKDKSVEVNTSGYKYGLDQPHPSFGILRRYYELGGRNITIGSDAHNPQELKRKFDLVEEKLKEIGFDGYLVYVKRKPVKILF